MNGLPSKARSMRGMTLVEVLAALVLTGITITLSSWVFLGAKSQSWLRGQESEMLRQAIVLRAAMEDSLQTGSLGCSSEGSNPKGMDGSLPGWTNVAAWRNLAPDLESLSVTCLQPEFLTAEAREFMENGNAGGYGLKWRATLKAGRTYREVAGYWQP